MRPPNRGRRYRWLADCEMLARWPMAADLLPNRRRQRFLRQDFKSSPARRLLGFTLPNYKWGTRSFKLLRAIWLTNLIEQIIDTWNQVNQVKYYIYNKRVEGIFRYFHCFSQWSIAFDSTLRSLYAFIKTNLQNLINYFTLFPNITAYFCK